MASKRRWGGSALAPPPPPVDPIALQTRRQGEVVRRRASPLGRLRSAITMAAGLGVIMIWGLPLMLEGFGPKTLPPLRAAVEAAVEFAPTAKPWVLLMIGVAVVAQLVAVWAWRQRRRLTEQVARVLAGASHGSALKLDRSGTTVWVGLRAPWRGTVPLPPGYVFEPQRLAEAEEYLSRAWHRTYSVRWDERRDKIKIRRRRRPTEDQAAEPKPVYFDAVHERLEEVRGAMPLDVLSIRPVPGGDEPGSPNTYYVIKYASTTKATEQVWQDRTAEAITALVGPTPDGKLLDAVWNPERDEVMLSEAREATPVYLDAVHERLEEVRNAMPVEVRVITPVVDADDRGQERTRYQVVFEPTMKATLRANQEAASDAITALVGPGVNGGRLEATWEPAKDTIWLGEVPPLPRYAPHPVIEDYPGLLGTDLLALPYGPGPGGRIMYWLVDPKSTTPHALIAGPTGSGKTTVIRALVTEGIRRGIPWVLLDPKFFELVEYEDYPGVLTVASEPMHMVEVILALYAEHQERKRVIRAERLNPGDVKSVPLWGAVFDEAAVMKAMLTRLARRDEIVKEMDPLGVFNEMVSEVRATGGRLLVGTQRPDAQIWGGGAARSNMGQRIAMGRMDKDGDEMMYPGGGFKTRHLDSSIPGRAIGTLPSGEPAEVQAWYTPNLDRHPVVAARRSAADQALVNSLLPATPPAMDLFLPRSAVPALFRKTDANYKPPRDRTPDRDARPAKAIQPGWSVVLDVDGVDVKAVVLDIEENADQIELEVRLDGESTVSVHSYGRDEFIEIVSTP